MFRASLMIEGQKPPEVTFIPMEAGEKERVVFSHGGDRDGKLDSVTVFHMERDVAVRCALGWRV